MHDKKEAFFEAADFLNTKKNIALKSRFFFAPSYQSPLMPNITLHIHASHTDDMKVISVVDGAERTLFYRPCKDQYVASVFNLLHMSRDIETLLDGLRILTHPDDSAILKPQAGGS